MRKRISLLIAVLCLIMPLFSFSVVAKQINYEELDETELYNYLLSLDKESFLGIAWSECDKEYPSHIFEVAAAFLDRHDFEEEELAEYICDKNVPSLMRHIAVECYSAESPSSIDSRILDIIQNDTESADLRTIIISLLADYMDSSDSSRLLYAANDVDANLSYNAIKALEMVDVDSAIALSSTIFENYKVESPARLNIASKILAQYIANAESVPQIASAVTLIPKTEFIEKCQTIIENIDNDEVQYTIGQSIMVVSENNYSATPIEPRATDLKGYAAYRDGVLNTIEWHAAIIVSSNTNTSTSFAQATGLNATTELVSKSGFLGTGVQQGYYRPLATLSTAQRNAVCNTATNLAYAHIAYVIGSPIRYYTNVDDAVGGKYAIKHIAAIRCDGLVEYSYEYNNIRIFGSDSYWDISHTGENYEVEHGSFSLTPKKQAQKYMIRIGDLP